ncbi:MAG: prolipoprotein diacylglyceryl transferase [Microgenomates group bacterium]
MTFNLYGLVLGIAILASFQASLWLAKERKIDIKVVEGLFWWVVAGGIVGARAYHVIDKWQEIYSLNPQSAFYIWNGGLAIWGAIIGGVTALFLGVRVARVKIHRNDLLDVVFFGLPLGQAIGRWGNFFNNEIVGRNGEPLFLYESVLNLVLFAVIWGLRKRLTGKIAGFYLVGYGLIRVVLETYRQSGDQWLVNGVSAATIFSVAAGIGGAFLLRKKS